MFLADRISWYHQGLNKNNVMIWMLCLCNGLILLWTMIYFVEILMLINIFSRVNYLKFRWKWIWLILK
jgi:hypothetical protein